MGILELALLLTAKGLVWLVSFGKWRGESLLTNESSIHAAAGALSFDLKGKRVVTYAGLMLIGMAFYGVLFPVLFFWFF